VTVLLGRLPERQRRLMRDVKIEGLSMEEAAEKRGMSVTAAKVAVHRGMKRLQSEVGDEDL
jgi:RNA polymerase sigma-70 factor (ECF subfamily)